MRHLRFTLWRFLRVIGKRPKLIVLLVLLVTVSGMIGFYYFGLIQWEGARAAARENRLDEAHDKLNFCLTVWPRWLPPPWDRVKVHHLAARCARLKGDFEAAEAHLNQCIKLEKGASEATQVEFLLMRVQTGEEDDVVDLLFAYVDKKHAESTLILETIARSYMHRLRYGPAYACLNRWIELAPDQAKPYHWRGWVLERMNSSKQAMVDYERALQRDPKLTEIRLHLGELLIDDNKPLEALAYLEPLYAEFPDRAHVMARLGQCLYLQGRIPEARKLLEAAVEKLPNDAPLLLCLARIDIAQGRPALAEQRLRHALTIDPSDLECQFSLATALRDQNRKEEAARELNRFEERKALIVRANELLQAEAQHPSRDPNAASEIGVLLLQFGQERQGLYWLDQALERDPDHQPTHKAYAEYFERMGETAKAAVHRQKLRSMR